MLTSDPPRCVSWRGMGGWGEFQTGGGGGNVGCVCVWGVYDAGNWKHNCSRCCGGEGDSRCAQMFRWLEERSRRKRRYERRVLSVGRDLVDAGPPHTPPVYEHWRCKSVSATTKSKREKKRNLYCLTAQHDFWVFFLFLKDHRCSLCCFL